VIVRQPSWQLVLNHNQNLLGKCFLALTRHEERVARLTPPEWIDLHPLVIATTAALQQAFQPDHFNYAFLQNQDRHIHMHIIPRYAQPRTFASLAFDDPDYPGHYAVPAPQRHLPPDVLATLEQQLRRLVQARL
jgi:diadenosine tetraphosphate (Ap4A) HIT family hydrolase